MANNYEPNADALRAELEGQLAERIERLRRAAATYDDGHYAEAASMAGLIGKLLDDRPPKRNFVSLLTRLGRKPITMPDLTLNGVLNVADLHGPAFVGGIALAHTAGVVPLLDGFNETLRLDRELTFDRWWEGPIIRDAVGNVLTRRDIVQTMRDKEESHTDIAWDHVYGGVAFEGTFAKQTVGATERVDEDVLRVAVRQIAHEVLRRLDSTLPIAYCPTRGRVVLPITLMRVHIKLPDGSTTLLLDHKAVAFADVATSDSETYRSWKSTDRAPVPPWSKQPAFRATGGVDIVAVQLVFLNFGPNEVQVAADVSLSYV